MLYHFVPLYDKYMMDNIFYDSVTEEQFIAQIEICKKIIK